MYFGNIKSYVKRQAFIALCLNIGFVVIGTLLAWPSPCMVKLQDITQTPLPYVITETEAFWLGSCAYIGCLVSFTAGYISNWIGRKYTFVLGGLLALISTIAITFPLSYMTLFIARTVAGYSTTVICMASITYIGEIASPDIRGTILASNGIFTGVGVLIVYALGNFVSYTTLGYVTIAVNVLYIAAILFIPESPLYIVMKVKTEEAKECLESLGRTNTIETELKAIEDFVNKQANQKKQYAIYELFKIKCNRRAFIIVSALTIFQNCNGGTALLLFALTIFEKAGTSLDSSTAMTIVGVIILVGSLVAPFCVENYGRRVLLLISTSLCGLNMMSLGVYFYLDQIKHSIISSIGWIPLTSLVISFFAHHIAIGDPDSERYRRCSIKIVECTCSIFLIAGLSIIPNTLAGEMFSSKVRGIGPSIAFNIGWAVGLVFNSSFGYIVVALGNHVNFFIFASINFVALIFTIFFVPETKGKSLIEIETMLAK